MAWGNAYNMAGTIVPANWGHQRVQSLKSYAKKHRITPKKIKRAKPVKSTLVHKPRANRKLTRCMPRKGYYVEFQCKNTNNWQRVGKSRTASGANKIARLKAAGFPPGRYRIVFSVEATICTFSVRR